MVKFNITTQNYHSQKSTYLRTSQVRFESSGWTRLECVELCISSSFCWANGQCMCRAAWHNHNATFWHSSNTTTCRTKTYILLLDGESEQEL